MTIGFDHGHDLDLDFSRPIWNLLQLSQKWPDCHETKRKHIDWVLGPKCAHRIWPWQWPWPWIFMVKNGICYILAKKWYHCQETKNKNIVFVLRLKCDHETWPCPWPWPKIFKVKYEIFSISTKKCSDCHKMKSKHIDWILCIKCNHWVWPCPSPWPWIFNVKFWNSRISGMGRRIDIEHRGWFLTITFWWPRWVVNIYPIVTGVTSDVGVPSTRLVYWCIHASLAFDKMTTNPKWNSHYNI